MCLRCPFVVGVRAGGFLLRFWYCKWECGWACWRPPAPWKCKGPTIWANSRVSFACFQREHRVRLDAVLALSLGRPTAETPNHRGRN